MNFSIEKLSKDFENRIQFYNRQKGNEIIRSGKVNSLKENVDKENELIEINATVLSQRNYCYYSAQVLIDGNTSEIEDTECECKDFSDNITSSNKYICKHISAVLSKYIALRIAKNKEKKKRIENMGEDILNELTSLKNLKEKINLEVHLSNKNVNECFQANFKIGKKKMYVLKNVRDFINARFEDKEIEYGKEFTYYPEEHVFNEHDENIIDFIEEFVANDELRNSYGYANRGLINGKYLNIQDAVLRRFLHIVGEKKITLNCEKVKIIEEDITL